MLEVQMGHLVQELEVQLGLLELAQEGHLCNLVQAQDVLLGDPELLHEVQQRNLVQFLKVPLGPLDQELERHLTHSEQQPQNNLVTLQLHQ